MAKASRNIAQYKSLCWLLCLCAGGVASFAMAPYAYPPLMIAGLSALYFTLAQSPNRNAGFLSGWLFGFGYFVLGLHWIGNALLVEGNPHAWAWPLAVAALPAALSFFPALACWAARRFFDLKTTLGFFVFCALLGLSEFLRGHIFTGFPWNLYGFMWDEVLPILQILAYSDVYVLTALSIFWAALGGFLLTQKKLHKEHIALFGFAIILFAAIYGWGSHRLSSHETQYHNDVHLRLVQPNIAQEDKWDRSKIYSNHQKLLSLSLAHTQSDKETLIIWPESATSYFFTENAVERQSIGQVLATHGPDSLLITGSLQRDPEQGTYQNSIVTLNMHGDIVSTYDKVHLVPFGEYIPFQEWIPITPVVNFSGFEAGPGPKTLITERGNGFSPLWCATNPYFLAT